MIKLLNLSFLILTTGCSATLVRISSEDRTAMYKNRTCQTPCSLALPKTNCDSSKIITVIKNSNHMVSHHHIIGCSDTTLYIR